MRVTGTAKRSDAGTARAPALEPTKTDAGNLIITRTPDAGSSAIRDWHERQVHGGEADRPLSRALHLTRPGKGGALPAGTFEFGEATLLSFATGSAESLDLAIGGSFRLSGPADRAAAAAAPARIEIQQPGWDPIPVLSWSLEGDGPRRLTCPSPRRP